MPWWWSHQACLNYETSAKSSFHPSVHVKFHQAKASRFWALFRVNKFREISDIKIKSTTYVSTEWNEMKWAVECFICPHFQTLNSSRLADSWCQSVRLEMEQQQKTVPQDKARQLRLINTNFTRDLIPDDLTGLPFSAKQQHSPPVVRSVWHISREMKGCQCVNTCSEKLLISWCSSSHHITRTSHFHFHSRKLHESCMILPAPTFSQPDNHHTTPPALSLSKREEN